MTWNGFDLGVVNLTGGTLEYSRAAGDAWSVKLGDIAVIGEWLEDVTLAPTPLDHWWVFVDNSGGYCIAPTRAAGIEFVRKELREAIGCDLAVEFFGTGLASRVVWPSELLNEPLFVFEPRRSRGPLGWLRDCLSGVNAEVLLSPSVRSFLGRRAGPM